MKKTKYNTQIVLALLAVSFLALELSALAQSVTSLRTIGNVKTDSRILYHNGLVLVGPIDLYFIWYGCWDDNCGTAGWLMREKDSAQ
jgi:hypothetical protein